ncbi:GHKL domain-containing protein [Metabacillus idriensis]|uniref:GHKL domain-containing protein n=1 Tax=Metabacillus idriensis TaxID=324768 RepID=UPI003D81395D
MYPEHFSSGFSTKPVHNKQGIGLSNIKGIISKYNGSIFPQVINDMVSFTVTIPAKGLCVK